MAYAVSLSRRSERDLQSLYVAIDAENSDAALEWYFGLRTAILTLEENPNRCPTTRESRRYRHLLYGKRPHVYRIILRS